MERLYGVWLAPRLVIFITQLCRKVIAATQPLLCNDDERVLYSLSKINMVVCTVPHTQHDMFQIQSMWSLLWRGFLMRAMLGNEATTTAADLHSIWPHLFIRHSIGSVQYRSVKGAASCSSTLNKEGKRLGSENPLSLHGRWLSHVKRGFVTLKLIRNHSDNLRRGFGARAVYRELWEIWTWPLNPDGWPALALATVPAAGRRPTLQK